MQASGQWAAAFGYPNYILRLSHRYKLTEDEVSTEVRSALRLVNLEDFMYRATHTLSGGQRQRVAIAGTYEQVVIGDSEVRQVTRRTVL